MSPQRIAILICCCLWFHLDALSDPGSQPDATVAEDPTLKALERVEEKQAELLRGLESMRNDSAADLKRNSEAIAQRLAEIELSLAEQRRADQQRQQDLQAQQSFNHTLLLYLAVLGGLGVIGLIAMGFFMLKTVRRVGDVLTSVALVDRPAQLLGYGGAGVQTRAAESTERFLDSMAQLDARLRQMEQKQVSMGK